MSNTCKYWDCGWCYAPDNVGTNADSQSACVNPSFCPYNVSIKSMTDQHPLKVNTYLLTDNQPERSEWKCYMFGNRPDGIGIIYTPAKGQVPNRFVRFMMKVCFDCLWVKEDNQDS